MLKSIVIHCSKIELLIIWTVRETMQSATISLEHKVFKHCNNRYVFVDNFHIHMLFRTYFLFNSIDLAVTCIFEHVIVGLFTFSFKLIHLRPTHFRLFSSMAVLKLSFFFNLNWSIWFNGRPNVKYMLNDNYNYSWLMVL